MNVGEIMSEQPVCVRPETDIVNAAVTMADHELGALPVCEQGRLIGIITTHDIVFRYLAGRSHQGRLVAHYMTRDPVTIRPDESLERAEALMSQYQIRRLPVCKHGRLIGMIGERDLPATRAAAAALTREATALLHTAEPLGLKAYGVKKADALSFAPVLHAVDSFPYVLAGLLIVWIQATRSRRR